MTLSETLLQKTGEWKPPPGQRGSLLVPDEGSGWAVTVTADRSDDVGCLLWEVSLRRTGEPKTDPGDLTTWAAGVAGRVTALVEPLKVLEVDLPRREALLRSAQASKRGNALRYYEVLVRGTDEVLLRRFQGFPQDSRPRDQVAFPLTHEALAQAAAELVGAQ